jgi:hypothetical protein
VHGRDALVPKVLTDLEDLVETAHQQSLEVELGSDAQVEVGVERVVMGDKRPRQRATRERLQDGRLHLDEALAFQVTPHRGDQLAAGPQLPGDVRVGDEVHIPLAVPGLAVLETVEFLRQGAHRLGEQRPRVGKYGQLASAGAEDVALHPDDVADVEVSQTLEGLVAQSIEVAVDLEVVPAVTEREEDRLAVLAATHDPAGHLVAAAFGLGARLQGGIQLGQLTQ